MKLRFYHSSLVPWKVRTFTKPVFSLPTFSVRIVHLGKMTSKCPSGLSNEEMTCLLLNKPNQGEMKFHCNEEYSSATPAGCFPSCSLQPRLQPANRLHFSWVSEHHVLEDRGRTLWRSKRNAPHLWYSPSTHSRLWRQTLWSRFRTQRGKWALDGEALVGCPRSWPITIRCG